jgi:hypothetical protein
MDAAMYGGGEKLPFGITAVFPRLNPRSLKSGYDLRRIYDP